MLTKALGGQQAERRIVFRKRVEAAEKTLRTEVMGRGNVSIDVMTGTEYPLWWRLATSSLPIASNSQRTE